MDAVWKDTTSYSQNERGKVAPRTWSSDIGNVDIKIHRHIYYEPDIWLMSCNYLNISNHELDSKDVDKAKEEALSIAKNMIEYRISEFQKQLDFFERLLKDGSE